MPIVLAINVKHDWWRLIVEIVHHPTRLLADIPTHLKLNQPLIIPLSMLPQFGQLLEGKEILDVVLESQKDILKVLINIIWSNSLVLSYSLTLVMSNTKEFFVGFDGYDSDDSRNDEINELF